MTDPLPVTRARRVVLTVGLPVVLALIGLMSYNAVALSDRASYRVHVSVPARGGQTRVTIDNADATVRPGSGDQISLTGTLQGSLARPSFSWRSAASGLMLHSRCWAWAGFCSLEYDIAAPAGLPLAVSDGYGDLNASGFAGHVTLSSGGGDITASRLSGAIELDSGGGDVTASGLDGSVRLSDGAGNIVVTGLAATDVVGDNGSGNITLTFTKVPRQVNVTDESGDITLVLPRGPTYYRVETSSESGNTSVSVNHRLSSPYVITASNGSGNITISY
jgi:hypothetical protein